jgi:hypothetical protein
VDSAVNVSECYEPYVVSCLVHHVGPVQQTRMHSVKVLVVGYYYVWCNDTYPLVLTPPGGVAHVSFQTI